MTQEVTSKLVWHNEDETPDIDGEYLVITLWGEVNEARWNGEGEYWVVYKYGMPLGVKAWCRLSDIEWPSFKSMCLMKRR